MKSRTSSFKGTLTDKFDELKKIVVDSENSDDKIEVHTNRHEGKKKQNQTVCMTSYQNCCPNTQKQGPIILEKNSKRLHS